MSASEKLAIDGGTPVRDTKEKPWTAWPLHNEEEWEKVIGPALREVYLSGTEGMPGAKGIKFADEFAKYCGAEYGLMLPHGTDAIMAALAGALDLDGLEDAGDVILPNYTFIASASAPLYLRLTVTLVDIDRETFTIDPAAASDAITDRTVAILPVHMAGHPADMEAINGIAKKHGLAVIEDCAQAHGAEHKGKKVGSLGDVGAYSFQSSKNLTAGEGGCVVTSSKDIRDRAHSFNDMGRQSGGERWEYPRLGWNFRSSEYLASLLCCRLQVLDEQIARRNENAAYLAEGLSQVEGITPPGLASHATQHGYHLYCMLYEPDEFGGKPRSDFVAAMQGEGISCSGGYTRPLTDEGALKGVSQRFPERVRRLPCPNVEYVCDHSIWLYQQMLLGTQEDMADVVEAAAKVKKAFAC